MYITKQFNSSKGCFGDAFLCFTDLFFSFIHFFPTKTYPRVYMKRMIHFTFVNFIYRDSITFTKNFTIGPETRFSQH